MHVECTTGVASSTCDYTQLIPLATVDWPVVLGLSVVIAIEAAKFVRYVFYR